MHLRHELALNLPHVRLICSVKKRKSERNRVGSGKFIHIRAWLQPPVVSNDWTVTPGPRRGRRSCSSVADGVKRIGCERIGWLQPAVPTADGYREEGRIRNSQDSLTAHLPRQRPHTARHECARESDERIELVEPALILNGIVQDAVDHAHNERKASRIGTTLKQGDRDCQRAGQPDRPVFRQVLNERSVVHLRNRRASRRRRLRRTAADRRSLRARPGRPRALPGFQAEPPPMPSRALGPHSHCARQPCRRPQRPSGRRAALCSTRIPVSNRRERAGDDPDRFRSPLRQRASRPGERKTQGSLAAPCRARRWRDERPHR